MLPAAYYTPDDALMITLESLSGILENLIDAARSPRCAPHVTCRGSGTGGKGAKQFARLSNRPLDSEVFVVDTAGKGVRGSEG